MTQAPKAVRYAPIESFDHRSRANGRDYRVFVAPALTEPEHPGRPLLVVLDGNFYTPVLSTNCRMRGGVADAIDEPHVVGIGYPGDEVGVWMSRRHRDLTPTTPTRKLLPEDDLSPSLWGDGDAFMSTVIDELMPLLAQRLAFDAEKTALFGHSFGALTCLQTLFTRPDAFRAWLAISPALWWEDGVPTARAADAFLRQLPQRTRAAQLFMAGGGLEEEPPRGMPPSAATEQVAELLKSTRMIGRTQALAQRLRAQANPELLTVESRILPEETHLTAGFAALGPALDFAFPRAGQTAVTTSHGTVK